MGRSGGLRLAASGARYGFRVATYLPRVRPVLPPLAAIMIACAVGLLGSTLAGERTIGERLPAQPAASALPVGPPMTGSGIANGSHQPAIAPAIGGPAQSVPAATPVAGPSLAPSPQPGASPAGAGGLADAGAGVVSSGGASLRNCGPRPCPH